MGQTKLLCWVALVLFGMGLAAAAAEKPPPAAPEQEQDASGAGARETPLNALLTNVQEVLDGVEAEPFAPSPISEDAPLVLDVHQCVARAFEQNAQALIAAEEVAARKAQVGQAISLWLPQVKGEVGYSYIQATELDIELPPLLNRLVGDTSFGKETSAVAAQLGLEQVIYEGGQILNAIKASKYLVRSQEWKKEATLSQLEYEAKQAFYNCLLARALVAVAEESIVTFQRHVSDARQMLDVGLVSRFVVLRAETELGARQTDHESARAASKIALLNLCRILALPQGVPVELGGKLEWTPVTETVEELASEASEARAELRALREAIHAAEHQVKAKRGQYLPKVAASAQYRHIEGDATVMPEGLSVTVGVQWDIFTGLRRKREIQEAKAQMRNLEHQLKNVEQLVELDVRQAHIRVEEAIAKIRREKGTVELGQEGLRLAELRFQEGAGTQAETLDAALALTQARTGLANALRDYAVAIAALNKAAGRSWMPREMPGSY